MTFAMHSLTDLLADCPTGCLTCTVDYSNNDVTQCTNGNCKAWDGTKAYTNNDAGGCTCKQKTITYEHTLNSTQYHCEKL